MKKYSGRKISTLTEKELKDLTKNISGYYTNENIQGVGSWDVIIDFEDGTSVAGWLIRDGDEEILEFNHKEKIYNSYL